MRFDRACQSRCKIVDLTFLIVAVSFLSSSLSSWSSATSNSGKIAVSSYYSSTLFRFEFLIVLIDFFRPCMRFSSCPISLKSLGSSMGLITFLSVSASYLYRLLQFSSFCSLSRRSFLVLSLLLAFAFVCCFFIFRSAICASFPSVFIWRLAPWRDAA